MLAIRSRGHNRTSENVILISCDVGIDLVYAWIQEAIKWHICRAEQPHLKSMNAGETTFYWLFVQSIVFAISKQSLVSLDNCALIPPADY